MENTINNLKILSHNHLSYPALKDIFNLHAN